MRSRSRIARLGQIDGRHDDDERSLLIRIFSSRPHDLVGACVASVAILAIATNALFLQAGPHPAPIFAIKPRPIAVETTNGVIAVLPRPRPTDSVKLDLARPDVAKPDTTTPARPNVQVIAELQKELARRGFYDGPIDAIYGAKMDGAIRDFEQASGLKPTGEPTEALLQKVIRSNIKALASATNVRRDPIADLLTPSKRVLAVQRALADFGYGQVTPTGLFDRETKAAIEKFERDRRLPVTGEISERLTRELAAMTGRPLD